MLPVELVAILIVYGATVVWLMSAALRREGQIRADHRQDLDRKDREHRDDIERVHAMYEKSITVSTLLTERVLNTAQFGTPTRPAAEVVENEPDAVTRAGRAVDEATIQVATQRLREEYARIGIPLTDEELEAEARALLQHGKFIPPVSFRSLIDGG